MLLLCYCCLMNSQWNFVVMPYEHVQHVLTSTVNLICLFLCGKKKTLYMHKTSVESSLSNNLDTALLICCDGSRLQALTTPVICSLCCFMLSHIAKLPWNTWGHNSKKVIRTQLPEAYSSLPLSCLPALVFVIVLKPLYARLAPLVRASYLVAYLSILSILSMLSIFFLKNNPFSPTEQYLLRRTAIIRSTEADDEAWRSELYVALWKMCV